MAGHSKWHNIRLRKGKQDAVRGKLFTKLSREIMVAAKEGGGNPDANFRLKVAIQKAKDNSMPLDTIKRAVEKGAGGGEGTTFEEVSYEGYGPGGVAVMVKVLTDNRNRTVADIRNAFSRCGGSLGETGCVGWMFKQRGLLTLSRDVGDEESVMLAALEAGADDFRSDGDSYEIHTEPSALEAVREAVEKAGFKPDDAQVTMLPDTSVSVTGKEAEQNIRLMETLEDLDDVQEVYSNFDISDEELAKG
jgi:YebC/PmpR family DNA-binding regulatory protein